MKAGKEITDEDFHYHEEDEFCPNCGTRYRDAQRRICPKCMNRKALLMRVLGYAPKYKLELFLIFVTILGSSALSLVRPQLNNRFLFDEVLSASSPYYGKILYLVLAILLLESVSLLVSVVNGRMGAKLAAHIIYDIKLELFSAMQKLSLSFYNRKPVSYTHLDVYKRQLLRKGNGVVSQTDLSGASPSGNRWIPGQTGNLPLPLGQCLSLCGGGSGGLSCRAAAAGEVHCIS